MQLSVEEQADWRADLLKAINYAFNKEREGLLSELRTHVVTHSAEDLTPVQLMEQRIEEQVRSIYPRHHTPHGQPRVSCARMHSADNLPGKESDAR